jgi:hypothetical protein
LGFDKKDLGGESIKIFAQRLLLTGASAIDRLFFALRLTNARPMIT